MTKTLIEIKCNHQIVDVEGAKFDLEVINPKIKHLIFKAFVDGYQRGLPDFDPKKGGWISKKGKLVIGGAVLATQYTRAVDLDSELYSEEKSK